MEMLAGIEALVPRKAHVVGAERIGNLAAAIMRCKVNFVAAMKRLFRILKRESSMTHSAIAANNVAVITGGASGIGLAAARKFAGLGLKVCIADREGERLREAERGLKQIFPDSFAMAVDVSRLDDLRKLSDTVASRFGGTDILMNNAGIQPGSGMFGPAENWQNVLAVNLWGVINGSQVFVPDMIKRGRPGLVINTGSKQGITTPPGDPAYNVSKAGVKVFTEALAHELRNTEGARITAHLLIPGFVFTNLTAKGRTEKPAGAWTPEQTVDVMFERLDAGDFYILCPDNEVTRELDEKRIHWAAHDIIENRPPLSRWHKDYGAAFTEFLKK
jgi:NAD(P)-dependent dehydrogenase (short-subunit alcohol dehydrogenase family)